MVDALTLATVFNAGHGTAGEKLVDPGFPLATGKEQPMSTRQQLEADFRKLQRANDANTVPCPACRNRVNDWDFCSLCYGARIVPATHKVPLDRKRILSWGIFWFVLAAFFLWVLVNQ